ncbi:MAG TPA: PilC/PilY family type IV pilus protein, partial [bacterium]|nr:PilC/PilY family type IV pilus protein [bacterium]
MRNLLTKTKKSIGAKLIVQILIVLMPFLLLSTQLDESLVDDVTAMITNAKKIAHTTFLLDTSESMNTFAFSDYINTCLDAKTNINNAIVLCDNAYNQCRNVEANAMCGVNLGCGDILTQCTDLRTTRISVNTFCAEVETLYAEPSKTIPIADPLGAGDNDAKKFVGPWDPRRADYLLDLCFYNWTEDTGGDVLDGSTSGHWTNPDDGSGNTDRRDWDCMTDGIAAPQNRSGVWLNWKYATSLDAVKIIMGDVHNFSYPPRARGERKCIKTDYYPIVNDPILGKICYQEFETNPADPLTMGRIKDHVRVGWKKATTEVADALCPGTDTFTVEKDTNIIPPDALSVMSGTLPCDLCRDSEGNEVPCREYKAIDIEPGAKTTISGTTATVEYSCCINYECTNPKCRDDDSSCRSGGGACILGYYSDFDQDQNHCCAMLNCVEPDPTLCASGGGTYLPGPGNDITVQFEKDLGMPVLAGSDEYQNVTLVATVKKLAFSAPKANVSKAVISIYYGCNVAGETPANKLGEKTYTTEISLTPDGIISAPIDMTGCEQSGYKVGGTMQVFHSGANFSAATVTMDIEFTVAYNSGSDQDIYTLNPAEFYYYEYRSEATGAVGDRVNEYECKTTFYHKQSLVVNGGPGSCPAKYPTAARCTKPDHTVIAQDQWGTAKKTACSWLCRDDVVYDDVWKCRSFFSQMDNPTRTGHASMCPSCYSDASPLQNCCQEVNAAQSTYNYDSLEPPETVKFSASGASLKCAVSGYEEGITSEGKRTYISGYMAEVITGHIKELGDSSYKLNVAGYVSPYEDASNKWYSSATLLNRSNSFLQNSFISVFETGKNGTRDVACIYDLLNNFEGEDCSDDCGTGCCSVSIGASSDMCDYPSFWMKIPNTEGGRLIYPAKILTGTELTNYKNTIRNLQAKGGSALGETLYDVWRYLGGMYSAHDPDHTYNSLDPANPQPYTSLFQSADPVCFTNDAIIISGGQPQFDDNYSIRTKTIQVAPADVPFVVPDVSDAWTAAKPYVSTNWYLSAFLQTANWVHTKDFWHSVDACRVDNNVNIYGYEVGGSTGGHNCTTAAGEDTTGSNVIDKIHTIAIGEWALAPLYNNPANTYLEDSTLKDAATNNGGQYFGLTAAAADQSGDVKTFNSLTDLFNQFAASGSDADIASGRPTWTSTIQAYDKDMENRYPYLYMSATIPIDNLLSRFWFGNEKRYSANDDSTGCNMADEVDCFGFWHQTIPEADCFTPADSGGDMTPGEFSLLMGGGAARKIKDKLKATGISCDNVVGSDSGCYTSGARNILYDDGTDMLPLKSADADWFTAKFAATTPSITKGQAIQILDYMSGYDAFDYDSDGNKNQVRFDNTPTVQVDDPFNLDFSGSAKVTIRPLLLGSITHSTPIAVMYNNSGTTRIFAGANDGMLHSFDQDGNETFAYIPMPVLPALTNFLDSRSGFFFHSTVDGPVTLFHMDYNNDGMINTDPAKPTPTEKAFLIFGYRRGAKGYTVIDISEMDNPKLVQYIPTEGQSWARPLVFRKCDLAYCSANDLTYYMVLPGGYDPCFDTDEPICPLNGSGHLDPQGNEISVYKFNKDTSKFDLVKKYDMYTSDANIRDNGWMRTSFVANPVAVSTDKKATIDTQFVYVSDLSNTVFRIDVTESDPDDWEFRAVFEQRAVPQPIAWGTGIRTYTAMNLYPPLLEYPTYDDEDAGTIIPIGFTTGNLVNPAASEIDEMVVFYDRFNFLSTDAPISSNDLKNMTGVLMDHGTTPWAKFSGWKVAYQDTKTEKGIVNPLMYNERKAGSYSLVW